ncbi:MAG: hypothetical protein WA667_05645 [Candidatus Nitrosopolaris sp.]
MVIFVKVSQLTNDDHSIDFYIYQWVPGLLLIFTSSTEKDYEKNSKRGITESWIKPSVFQEMKDFLVEKYDAEIYRFISRRYRYWNCLEIICLVVLLPYMVDILAS